MRTPGESPAFSFGVRVRRQAASNCSLFAQSSVLSSARAEPVEQLVDFGRADDQRRDRSRSRRRSRAHDQAFLLGEMRRRGRRRHAWHRTNACSPCRRRARRRRPGPCRAPRRPADARRAPGAAIWNCGARLAAFSTICSRCVDLQRLDRDRGGHRMTAIGEAVAEGADLFALDEQRLVHDLPGSSRRRSADRPTTAPWRSRSSAA